MRPIRKYTYMYIPVLRLIPNLPQVYIYQCSSMKEMDRQKKGRATSCVVPKVNQNLEGITPHPSDSSKGLVTFDISVDSPHKECGTQIANSTCVHIKPCQNRTNIANELTRRKGWELTTKYPQSKTEHHGVTKVEAGLEKAGHLCLHMVVVYGV
jgi:hypothetical protein